DLQTSINKCIEMYAHRVKYMKKFEQMIRYPLILLLIFSTLLYFVKNSVLPSFVDLFQESSAASSTVILSMMIIDYLGIFVMACCFMVFACALFWQFNKRKIKIDKQIKFYNALPIYRKFLKLQTSFLFATHISTLLKTGMSIKEILHHLAKQEKLPIIAHYSNLMIEELSKGYPISSLLSQFSFLDKQIATIFQKNANMDALEKDLTIYAEMLTEELQRKIIKAITLIQPLFFIILASFIIFIYVTLMWPMFQLINSIYGDVYMLKNNKGFTLIEMLIVLMIISVLIILSVPNLGGKSKEVNDKGCDALVSVVQAQVDAYYLDNGNYPLSLDVLKSA